MRSSSPRRAGVSMNGSAILTLTLAALVLIAPKANAQAIALQNATATFSQTLSGDFSVARAIDGITADGLGWAIAGSPTSGDITTAQTAVFETVTNAGVVGGTQLTFNLQQLYGTNHELGRFRLSLTQDNRATFADGLQSGGAVAANWTVLAPTSLLSANGATLTVLGDNSILASGVAPATDTYTVVATTNLTNITGFRIEALADSSFGTNGPGRQANGNFVLTEFSISGVAAPAAAGAPEPGSFALILSGSVGMAGVLVRRRRVTAKAKTS